ncbi:DUF3048 domain-containing protein [Halobacillus litoralis]|uniref:DUF3048 domain-containing protein n=1 Tax=Halobacillus litoralis TaxID=45668 RepID=UPI001CFF32E2|nr:DUF3048 domain-containing protein [Halobacillus litoralis]
MRKLTFFCLLFILLLTACNGTDDIVQRFKEWKEKDTAAENQNGNEKIFPLTGEQAPDQVDHRILSVMINNHTKARPQTGLSQADIVYEVLAEGQITRFLALFHSEIPDTIGPVRSARPYFLEIARGFNALYVYHGASNKINDQVAASGINYLDGALYDNNGWLFQRSSDRQAPHNSYLLTQGIERMAEQKGYVFTHSVNALPFDSQAELDGTPVNHIIITYGPRTKVRYSYKPKEGFLRSSDGEPTVDRADGEQIAVENLWIIKADHRVMDSAGRREINLKSGGTGYLLQKGQMKEVQWKNISGRLLPFEDGKALPFLPGKTWVNIISENTTVERS